MNRFNGSYPPNGQPAPNAMPPAPYGEAGLGYVGQVVPARRDGFRDLLDIVYRGKWVIIAGILIGTGVAFAYNYYTEPVYQTDALVFVSRETQTDLGKALGDQIGITDDSRTLANEVVILQESESIRAAVAGKLTTLQMAPGTSSPLTIAHDLEGNRLDDERVAGRLGGYVGVRVPQRSTDFIAISATSTIPEEAAIIANYYAEEFEARTQRSSRERITATREFLEAQVSRLEGGLNQLEGEMSDYIASEGAVALDDEASRLVEQIANLEVELDKARIERQMRTATLRSMEDELARIEPRMAQRIASGIDRDLTITQTRIKELELEREQIYNVNPGLRERLVEGPERLEEIQSELLDLQNKLTYLSQEYVGEVLAAGGVLDESGLGQVTSLNRNIIDERIALSGFEAQEQVLEARLREYRVKMQEIPEQTVQLAQLRRNQQVSEQTYLFVVGKLQEARIAEESEIGYAEIIRRAKVPGLPISPNKQRNMILGFLLGLGGSLALVVAWIRLDNRIYRPEDLREYGHTLIGVIPDMKPMLKGEFGKKEVVEIDGRRVNTALISLLSFSSPIVENYRQVRTNIQFATPDKIVQTLMVTSSGPGEGKSVTAANLAVVMAQAGRRTLLIDCDLRRPRVHKLFGMERQPGFAEVIFGQVVSLRTFESYIDELDIMPAGASVPNPAEVLASQRFREFLSELRETYDVIIVDTPPVMVATDAVLLSTQCDATLVVVRAGSTQRHELEQANEAIRNVGGNIVGHLLNDFSSDMAHGYKYKYRQYDYGYGYKYKSYYSKTLN